MLLFDLYSEMVRSTPSPYVWQSQSHTIVEDYILSTVQSEAGS